MERIFYFLTILIFSGCVDEINLLQGGEKPRLVVDGWLSNDPNLSYVKVYYSAPFQSGLFHLDFKQPDIQRIYVESALDGDIIEYNISGDASSAKLPIYIPRDSYTFSDREYYRLNIILENNFHYQSSWQEVAPQSTIQNFEYDIVQKIIFIRSVNGPAIRQKQYFLDIKANIEKNPDVDYGFYIKTSGIEEAITVSEDEYCTCTCYVPFPYIYDGLNVAYINDMPGSVLQQDIGSLTMGRLFRFWIQADVYAVNSDQSKYLLSISDQQKNSGSIFDPIPFKIKGNISNVNDETDEVLGHFFTAHHSRTELIVNRSQFYAANPTLDYYLDLFQEVDHTCLEYYTEGTIIPPRPFR